MQAPIHLRTLLYLPTRNAEKLSMQRSEPGVNLYARKVLIQARSKALVPDWLRFVKGTARIISCQVVISLSSHNRPRWSYHAWRRRAGVCDSEDIPLNLSREMLQVRTRPVALRGLGHHHSLSGGAGGKGSAMPSDRTAR